jgi:hypothetical protein
MAPGTPDWKGHVLRTFQRHDDRFEHRGIMPDPAELATESEEGAEGELPETVEGAR